MAEWLKAHAWKACSSQGDVGSNPSLSAILNERKIIQTPETNIKTMKKLFALFALMAMISIGSINPSFAQDPASGETQEMTSDSVPAETSNTEAAPQTEAPADEAAAPQKEVTGKMQTVKRYFIEGDPLFMSFVLICLILGLALAIERIIYLNMSTTNTAKLLDRVGEALNTGGVEAAKDVCRNTRGPVAAIFYQGLDRADDITMVEKSIEQYGSIQMSLLERGLSWISLFIALAPMLGFMGTVFGMIIAFDKIAVANTISAAVVAGGIKVALLTTIAGLIVAIILQIFYNYILAKIDSIVIEMEESSMQLVDALHKRNINRK